jgi:hypothetical protein
VSPIVLLAPWTGHGRPILLDRSHAMRSALDVPKAACSCVIAPDLDGLIDLDDLPGEADRPAPHDSGPSGRRSGEVDR